MVTDDSYIGSEYSIIRRIVESLYYIPEPNGTLCVNYTSILKIAFQMEKIKKKTVKKYWLLSAHTLLGIIC